MSSKKTGSSSSSGTGSSSDALLKAIQEVDQAYARRAEADAGIRRALANAATAGIRSTQDSAEATQHLNQFLAGMMPW